MNNDIVRVVEIKIVKENEYSMGHGLKEKKNF